MAALSLSSGCLNGAEAPFFTTVTALGRTSPGSAAGFLNLFGNLGGVLSIWLVPRMSEAWGWDVTLAFWSGVCLVAALLWLVVSSVFALFTSVMLHSPAVLANSAWFSIGD